jgi:hypothetical protein
MAYIVFGPPDLRAPVQEDRPFGFSTQESASEVVQALNLARSGFATVHKVDAATGDLQEVYVLGSSVLWVEDE